MDEVVFFCLRGIRKDFYAQNIVTLYSKDRNKLQGCKAVKRFSYILINTVTRGTYSVNFIRLSSQTRQSDELFSFVCKNGLNLLSEKRFWMTAWPKCKLSAQTSNEPLRRPNQTSIFATTGSQYYCSNWPACNKYCNRTITIVLFYCYCMAPLTQAGALFPPWHATTKGGGGGTFINIAFAKSIHACGGSPVDQVTLPFEQA